MSRLSMLLLVLLAIMANTSASLLLKDAVSENTGSIVDGITRNILAFGLALFAYGVAFVAYAAVLKAMPVSKAYMLITFGAQALIIIFGAIVFGERLTVQAWAGLILVFTGLSLVFQSNAE